MYSQEPSTTPNYPNEFLLKWAKERSDEVYLKQTVNGEYITYTYSEVADKALRIVSALQDLGAQSGDRIALISKNCAEWFICDLALMMGDFVSVPIFPTAGVETIEHCLSHSEAKIAILGRLDKQEAILDVLKQQPQLITIGMNYHNVPNCQHNLSEIYEQYQPSDIRPVHNDDKLMSIVYTSGTSGLAKGAMLTYGGFAWSAQHLLKHFGIEEGDRLFSYLPLAHITERVYIFGSSIISGIPTAFPDTLETFVDDLKMHQPTLFISVPRLWTIFHQGVLKKMPQRKLNLLLKIPVINTLVKRKIAKNLGLAKARVLGSGSAPISPNLLHWYHSIGLNITEAWGMTENFAVGTINHPFRADKIGTIGRVIPGVELRIADDKEIMQRSKGLLAGYYKDEKSTAEIIDKDGWLHTGDMGSLDDEGFLSIEGRKKDSFKTAKGKYVSPVPIENKLFSCSRVEFMCLIGSGLPAPVLLMVPNSFPNFDRERYERGCEKIITQMNAELESHEKIKGVLMIKEPWSIENGILTPTLKIKRNLLEKKYHKIGENWPKGKLVVWEE